MKLKCLSQPESDEFKGDLSTFNPEDFKRNIEQCINSIGSEAKDVNDIWNSNAKIAVEHNSYLFNKIDMAAEYISSKAGEANCSLSLRLINSCKNDKYCSTRENIFDQINSHLDIHAVTIDEFEVITSNMTCEKFIELLPSIYDLIINVRSFQQSTVDLSSTCN
jgi:hypothetical protein